MIATMGSTTQSLIEGSRSRGVWGAVAAICAAGRRAASACAARREAQPTSLWVSRFSGGAAQRVLAQRSDRAAAHAWGMI